MEFSLSEKLAIVHLIDSLILADGEVHKGEINILSSLMKVIDFDSNFLMQARNLETDYSIKMLQEISNDKKEKLVIILQEVAISDGYVHQKEQEIMKRVFSTLGIAK